MSETIKIGRMYKSSYDSIVKIVEVCGFTSINNVGIKVENGKIYYGDNIYEYDNSKTSIESSNMKFQMEENGANWFNNFRETKQISSFDSEWKDLIQNIAYRFHGEYSFLEFDRDDYKLTENEKKEKRIKAEEIIKKFFNLKNIDIRINISDDKNKTIIDYYGAILKLEVSDNSESEVILGKVYFKKEPSGKYIPILEDDAKAINDIFIMKANDSKIQGIKRVENIPDDKKNKIMKESVEHLTDAIIDLINDPKKDFSDYLFLHHEGNNHDLSQDEKIIKQIIDKAPSLSEVNIICKGMSLLSIVHAKWNTVSFGCYVNNKKYLDFEFGLRDSVTVRCSLCNNKNPLIYDDMLIYEDENTSKTKSIYDEDILDYVSKSEIANHIIIMDRCKSKNRDIDCKRNIVCKKDLFEIDGKLKCLNCHFPEVVYIGNDNKPRLNRNLFFASDTNDLYDKEQIIECRICGRNFVNIAQSICPQCSNLLDNKPSNDEKKIYKRYAHMLPLRKRMGSFYKDKCGYEDDELIVLRISKIKLAIIDKFDDYKDVNVIYSTINGK